MLIDKYAMAVQIEDDLFEIFDILSFEQETEMAVKYKNAVNSGITAISIPIKNKTKIGPFLNENNISFNFKSIDYEISENEDVYLMISNNIVFSFMLMEQTNPDNKKYQAAFGSDVVIIDVSLENDIGVGDLWNRKKIIKVL